MLSLLHDVRYGLRVLARSPGFTAVAALTLALGIGANTAIFTVVNAVLLRPLPVTDPSSIYILAGTDEKETAANRSLDAISWLNFLDYRAKNTVFSGVTGFTPFPVSLSGTGTPEQIPGMLVSSSYFDVLGVTPALGRAFLPQEDREPTTAPVVVLSHGLWKRRFGSDPGILGRTIEMNRQPVTVVGVAPEGFRGTFALGSTDLWIPTGFRKQVVSGLLREFVDDRRATACIVMGRLKPGVAPGEAQAQLRTLAAQLEREYPNENAHRSVVLLPLAQATVDPNQRGLFVKAAWLLMTVVGLVLLIACANLGNLSLVRAAGRERETAVRLSLGATRGRLVRQLVTESMLLSLLGGALGLGLAVLGRDLLLAASRSFFDLSGFGPNPVQLDLDVRVFGFTVCVSLLTGILFGLVPALKTSSLSLSEVLKRTGSRAGSGGARRPLRGVLIASEIALSMVALILAGLFVHSLRNMQQINPGFETRNLAVMSFNLGAQNYSETHGKDFERRLLENLRSLPMVRAASISSDPPFLSGFVRTIFPEGLDPSDPRSGTRVMVGSISPDHFAVTGIPILRGRNFVETDRENAPDVAIINEAMAARYFSGRDPIGLHIRFFGETWVPEIVGIARNSKYGSIGEDPQPYIYLPMWQRFSDFATLFVRASGDPVAAIPTIRGAVQAMDPALPLLSVASVSDFLGQALWVPRMSAALLVAFGGLALLLAAIGVYGVISYSVGQRTHELGIRMALGARPSDVLRMVVGQGMRLALLGAAAGLIAALVLTRALVSLLYGVSATDSASFFAGPAVLLGAAFLACYLPARRATRIDPVRALRYE